MLPGIKIPDRIEITCDILKAENTDIIIIATPSFAVRQTAKRLKKLDFGVVVNVSKGFEQGSALRLSEVISEELPGKRIVVLFRSVSCRGGFEKTFLTTVVAGFFRYTEAAEFVQSALMCESFRIYIQTVDVRRSGGWRGS